MESKAGFCSWLRCFFVQQWRHVTFHVFFNLVMWHVYCEKESSSRRVITQYSRYRPHHPGKISNSFDHRPVFFTGETLKTLGMVKIHEIRWNGGKDNRISKVHPVFVSYILTSATTGAIFLYSLGLVDLKIPTPTLPPIIIHNHGSVENGWDPPILVSFHLVVNVSLPWLWEKEYSLGVQRPLIQWSFGKNTFFYSGSLINKSRGILF